MTRRQRFSDMPLPVDRASSRKPRASTGADGGVRDAWLKSVPPVSAEDRALAARYLRRKGFADLLDVLGLGGDRA